MSRGRSFTFETDNDAGRTILGNIEIANDALVLSTNSKERADKGRELLLSRLDGLVGQPLTSHQTLEKMLDERSGSAPVQSELPPEVAEQAIHSFLDSLVLLQFSGELFAHSRSAISNWTGLL